MPAAAAMMFAVNRNRFVVNLSATSVNASGRQTTLTTGSVTATPSGGEAPYTPRWSQTGSDGTGTWTISNPNGFTTTFTCTGIDPGDTGIGTFSCTATDAIGDPPAVTPPVTAYAQNTL